MENDWGDMLQGLAVYLEFLIVDKRGVMIPGGWMGVDPTRRGDNTLRERVLPVSLGPGQKAVISLSGSGRGLPPFYQIIPFPSKLPGPVAVFAPSGLAK